MQHQSYRKTVKQMQLKKISLLALVLTFALQYTTSQSQSNSPYTRFGYGEISQSTPAELKAMGGVSMANRSKYTINSLNPASYTSTDSLTFMFDIGASGRISRFSDKQEFNNTFNANFDYIKLRFPLAKWLAVSAGLEPYSMVGYNFRQTGDATTQDKKISTQTTYTQNFTGKGGLSQAYAGLSVKLLDHISLGANTYYLFGEINNIRSVFFNDARLTPSNYFNSIKANDLRWEYGIQLYHTINAKHNLTIGAIYTPKHQLNGNFSAILNQKELLTNKGFDLPQSFGLGLNYQFDQKLTIGAEYQQTQWQDVRFFNQKDTLLNTQKIALGAEYIPNPTGRKYSDHIRYRLGANTTNQYYQIANNKAGQNFTISLGVGLPVRTGKSIMNIALEYGKIGNSATLREDFIKISFSANINEYWFFKPKL